MFSFGMNRRLLVYTPRDYLALQNSVHYTSSTPYQRFNGTVISFLIVFESPSSSIIHPFRLADGIAGQAAERYYKEGQWNATGYTLLEID